MIGLTAGTRIWLAAGVTDMQAGFNRLPRRFRRRWPYISLTVTCSCSVAGAAGGPAPRNYALGASGCG